MSNVVLVWELGSELGHVSRLNVLAHELAQRGHQVTCVLSDPGQFCRISAPDCPPPFKVLPGPAWPAETWKLSREPANISEVLLAVGYHEAGALAHMIESWRRVLAPLNPDIIIYDYAPTALLATRDDSCLKVGLDDPFTKPPNTSPLPSFNQDPKVSLPNLAISEQKLLTAINLALHQCGIPEIEQVYEVFETQLSFLLSIPELDPFSELRGTVEYAGLMDASNNKGVKLQWTAGSPAKKIFAYLKHGYPCLHEFLSVLYQMGIDANVFIPDASLEIIKKYHNTQISISTDPYDLSKDLNQVDLVVCHGGHGTVVGSVLSGVPVLIIPLQQEQLTTARKCIRSGLGQGLGAGVKGEEKIMRKIEMLLGQESYRECARSCQFRYFEVFKKPAAQRLAEQLESKL